MCGFTAGFRIGMQAVQVCKRGGGGWEALIFGFVGMRACVRGAQMPNKPYSLNVRSNSNYMWFGCDLSVTGAFDACSRQPSPALHSCRPPCSLQASI